MYWKKDVCLGNKTPLTLAFHILWPPTQYFLGCHLCIWAYKSYTQTSAQRLKDSRPIFGITWCSDETVNNATTIAF